METIKIPETPPLTLIFPHNKCSRCGGTGHYSYHQLHGTKCLKCHGAGFRWRTQKIRTAVNRYCDEIEAKRNPIAYKIEVGDVLWLVHKDLKKQWRMVKSIEDNGDIIIFTFTCGLRFRAPKWNHYRRHHPIDWRVYAEEAGLNVQKIEEQLRNHYSSQ